MTHTERTCDLLDIVAAQTLLQNRSMPVDEALRNVYVDISQSHTRMNWSRRSIVGTFTTSTELYSFAADRIILPCEMAWLHGFPRSMRVPREMSPKALKDAVGNGMSLPSLGAMLYALRIMRAREFEVPPNHP